METARVRYGKEKIMTLYKQIALLVSSIIIIMLGSVMYINYSTAKQNMIDALYETTVNNISTIGGLLGNAGEDKALIGSIIDSELDAGYYQLIEYKLNSNEFEYKKVSSPSIEGIPLWFRKFTDIKVHLINMDISSGWEILGSLQIMGDSSIVYKTLYKMFINMMQLFIVFAVISLLVLALLLHFILKPLKSIQHQAEGVVNNQFTYIEKVPYTQEFKEVVTAMNSMVKRVEEIFNMANESAKRNRELLYNDTVTKLFNRRYLMLKLTEILESDNAVVGGVSIFVSLESIENLTKIHGQVTTNNFLYSFAQILLKNTNKYEEGILAHVHISEFTILATPCTLQEAGVLIETIEKHFYALLEEYNIEKEVLQSSYGVYDFSHASSISELLTKTDSALLQAKVDEESNICFYEEKEDKLALAKTEWHDIFNDVIEEQSLQLKFWNTLNIKEESLYHNVMTFSLLHQDNEYFFGEFIAPASNFNLVSKLSLLSIEKLFVQKHKELQGHVCSVRLSSEFLKDKSTYTQLSRLFKKYAKKLHFQVDFEVSNSLAINSGDLVCSYSKLFKKYGFGFGINSFTTEAGDLQYLQNFNPQFIKADGRFLLDQPQASLDALHGVSHALEIDIIATFVQTKEDVDKLKSKDIILLQGPVTEHYKL